MERVILEEDPAAAGCQNIRQGEERTTKRATTIRTATATEGHPNSARLLFFIRHENMLFSLSPFFSLSYTHTIIFTSYITHVWEIISSKCMNAAMAKRTTSLRTAQNEASACTKKRRRLKHLKTDRQTDRRTERKG